MNMKEPIIAAIIAIAICIILAMQLEASKSIEMAKLGLQECPIEGSYNTLWQKECSVIKKE